MQTLYHHFRSTPFTGLRYENVPKGAILPSLFLNGSFLIVTNHVCVNNVLGWVWVSSQFFTGRFFSPYLPHIFNRVSDLASLTFAVENYQTFLSYCKLLHFSKNKITLFL